MINKEAGISQLKNGSWSFRFCISVNGQKVSQRGSTDANGNPLTTKAAAIKAKKAAIALAQLAPYRQPCTTEKKTFEDVFNEYRENGCADRAYNTILKQDSIWKNHLHENFGSRIIEDISTAEINDYLSKLYYDEEYSYRYVESFLKMFYLILGQAYSRNYLSTEKYNKLCKNKDTKIHMPKLKVDEDLDIVAFSPEECLIIDKHFTGSNAETAYLLGRFCGLRINECYGLKWSQIDLANGVIHIHQQMQYQDGIIKLVPLKTRNAKRDVYLNKRMIDYFTALVEKRNIDSVRFALQREQNQTFIHDTNGEKLSSLDLVNCLPNGIIQTVNSMKYHSRSLKDIGINFKFHYLRHTYGTRLAEHNTPAHLLCKQMGHANIHITERYYIAISQNGVNILKKNLELL